MGKGEKLLVMEVDASNTSIFIFVKFYILVHDTGGSSEIIQTNSDCDDGCDENPLDVLLETMRTMDGM